jgi:hypothetical protein
MTAYRSLILHHVRIGSGPAAAIFALRMAARIRNKQKGPQKEELANGDDEGGSAVAADVAAPCS